MLGLLLVKNCLAVFWMEKENNNIFIHHIPICNIHSQIPVLYCDHCAIENWTMLEIVGQLAPVIYLCLICIVNVLYLLCTYLDCARILPVTTTSFCWLAHV